MGAPEGRVGLAKGHEPRVVREGAQTRRGKILLPLGA